MLGKNLSINENTNDNGTQIPDKASRVFKSSAY